MIDVKDLKNMSDDLVQLIKRAAWMGVEIHHPVRAIVKSVDESNYMVTAVKVEDDSESEAPVYEAYLRAATVGQLGVILVPEKDSIVVIGFTGNREEQGIVLLCSKVDKVIFNIKTKIEFKIDGSSTSVLAIDENGIVQGNADNAEPALLGDKLKTWAQSVDQALESIINWGASGVAGTGGTSDTGGISPLSGVTAPSFDDATLSETNKVS